MKKNKLQDTRAVRTSIFDVNRDCIDWERFCQKYHIIRYTLPPRTHRNDRHYYARMHNWYKSVSDFPCYLHIYGPHLYVSYKSGDEIKPLVFKDRLLRSEEIDVEAQHMLPMIIKLLVADFFQLENRFVSNKDFILWATSKGDFLTGLELKIVQNWHENDHEFVIQDEAKRLRKLRLLDYEKLDTWKKTNLVYYGRFYQKGLPIFKQLKAEQLSRTQMKEGIYEPYEGSPHNRASLTFHSVTSLQALQQSRSYLLNDFMGRFIKFLNDIGIPCRQKPLRMKPVHQKSTSQMQKQQLPCERQPIYIIDDRYKARSNQDDFGVRFCAEANRMFPNQSGLFQLKLEADIKPGDWLLRLQDYVGDEFDSEQGILKSGQDTKSSFYERHEKAIIQTLNVNENSALRNKSRSKKNPRTWSEQSYLDYPVPTQKALLTKLEVCRNQLFLKDIIQSGKGARKRMPQLELVGETLFIYEGALLYLNGDDLEFIEIVNNLEPATKVIKERTGWDLVDDILLPSIDKYYFKGQEKADSIPQTLKRPFMINRDFIWEIAEAEGRVIHEDQILKQRLEILEEPIAIKRYYPLKPIKGNEFFTESQLYAYAHFLDNYVTEALISYTQLKRRYGKHLRDDHGRILVKDGGFFNLLGIHNDLKFKKYLNICCDLAIESIREDQLFPAYKGIWYSPTTQHYVSGAKDARAQEQERGHTLRQIIVHQGEVASTTLTESFFPMLEVNFIRHKNYTVRPFPFTLLSMWMQHFAPDQYFSSI